MLGTVDAQWGSSAYNIYIILYTAIKVDNWERDLAHSNQFLIIVILQVYEFSYSNITSM